LLQLTRIASIYISYDILWEDGTGDYIENVPSGEEVKVYHTWYYPSNYSIIVYAIDETHRESEYAYLQIEIPRTRTSSYQWFLERFPLLERLLGLL